MHSLTKIFHRQYPKIIPHLSAMAVLLAIFFLVSCSTPERAWKSAQTRNTRESYRHFLDKYPGHALAAEARMRIEEMDWKSACKTGMADAFLNFLKTYPKPSVSRLAAIPAEIVPGLVLQQMDIRYLNPYDGKTPEEANAANWFSGGSYSMNIGYFKGEGKPEASDPGYLKVTLFLRGTGKTPVPWTIGGDGGIGIDVSLVTIEGKAQPPLGFLIPGLGIAGGSLATGWKGNLGIELAEKKETWIVLMFAAPSREELAILKIKNFAIILEAKPDRS